MIQGVGSFQLCFGRFHPGAGGDHLKVRAADGKHDQILRIPREEFIGAKRFFGRPVVVPGSEIGNGLCEVRAQIEIVERAHHGWNSEACNRRGEAQPRCFQVGLLCGFGQGAADVRHQGASDNAGLSLRLLHRETQSHGAEVVFKAPCDGFFQRKFPGERYLKTLSELPV